MGPDVVGHGITRSVVISLGQNVLGQDVLGQNVLGQEVMR